MTVGEPGTKRTPPALEEIKLSFYDENKFLAARIPDKGTVAVIKTHRIGAGIDSEVTVHFV